MISCIWKLYRVEEVLGLEEPQDHQGKSLMLSPKMLRMLPVVVHGSCTESCWCVEIMGHCSVPRARAPPSFRLVSYTFRSIQFEEGLMRARVECLTILCVTCSHHGLPMLQGASSCCTPGSPEQMELVPTHV